MALSGCITRGRGGQFKILAGAHIRKTFILSLPRDISVHTKVFFLVSAPRVRDLGPCVVLESPIRQLRLGPG